MIRGRDLVVTLGGRRILDHVDFHVARGEAVALIGQNGAGKTTVLRFLLGLVHGRGEITIAGIDPACDPVGARRLIGYMPQTPAFLEETARASLSLLARLREVREPGIDALLERVGLREHARRSVRTFSTGMKQRLSLAAALIGDPPVLALDEPTASLDLAGQRELIALLGHLRAEGRTLLMTSHRAGEIRALCDRAIALDQGRVIAEGAVDQVVAQVWPEEVATASKLRVVR